MNAAETFTAEQVAERMGVDIEKIDELVADGILPEPVGGEFPAPGVMAAKRQVTQQCWNALRDMRQHAGGIG